MGARWPFFEYASSASLPASCICPPICPVACANVRSSSVSLERPVATISVTPTPRTNRIATDAPPGLTSTTQTACSRPPVRRIFTIVFSIPREINNRGRCGCSIGNISRSISHRETPDRSFPRTCAEELYENRFDAADARGDSLFFLNFECSFEFRRISDVRPAAKFYRKCVLILRFNLIPSTRANRVDGDHVGILGTEFMLRTERLRLVSRKRRTPPRER